MTSTKRLKHISMMLLWDDVEYIEKELCQSHGDLSHIFRNVFHNFVEQIRSSKKITEEKEKKSNGTNTDNKTKTKKSKPNRTTKRKVSASGGSARKGRK